MLVSPLCIGTFNFSNPTPEDESFAIVKRANEAGINFFDTGSNYNAGESERILGRAIAKIGNRHQFIVGTKAHYPTGPGPNDRGNSRRYLLRVCEESLKRLGMDYIDLFQVHRAAFDIPQDETLGALDDLVRQGKVRYIGCSTHPAWKVMEGLMVSESKRFARYVSEQPPYNLLDRRIENELIPMCQAHGLAIIPYAPLAQGVLSGRYADAKTFPSDSRAARLGGIYAGRVNEAGVAIGQRFAELAKNHGMTAPQLALLWAKDQPGVTSPIFGPRTLKQVEEILPVLDMTLTRELQEACDRLVPPGTAVVNFHNSVRWMKEQVDWVIPNP